MITITYEKFMAALALFTALCIAVGWVIKIVRGLKAPKNEIDDKLQRDYDRINQHDKEMKEIRSDLDYLKDALKLLLENDKVMFEHIRTNNATGKIANRETATFNFLNEHQR